jgi:hypothetical protein
VNEDRGVGGEGRTVEPLGSAGDVGDTEVTAEH